MTIAVNHKIGSMRTPSVQATFYKSLLQKFKRLMRITSPGKNPARKASPASMAFVQSLTDAWKSLYPYTFIGKMIRFYRANTFGDRDKISRARVALHTKSQYYAEKLICVLRDVAHAKSCFQNKNGYGYGYTQSGGMRALGDHPTTSPPVQSPVGPTSVGGHLENKKNDANWGVLHI